MHVLVQQYGRPSKNDNSYKYRHKIVIKSLQMIGMSLIELGELN